MASILLNQSLQTYFFQELEEVNNKSHRPLPVEILHYGSNVLDKFSSSSAYFDVSNGKIQEKILGIKLLEAGSLETGKQIESLKDIGDTALCLCGFFAKSVNKKLVDIKYYKSLGRTAYHRLSPHMNFYDDPKFFIKLSNVFDDLTLMIKSINSLQSEEMMSDFLVKWDGEETQSEDQAVLGIHPSKKIAS